MFSNSKGTPYKAGGIGAGAGASTGGGSGAGVPPSPFVSPSFRQMSLTKRKREHTEASEVQPNTFPSSTSRVVKVLSASHTEDWTEAPLVARLLSSGNIITWRDDCLAVHQDVVRGNSDIISAIDTGMRSMVNLHNCVDVGPGPMDSLDIACCSPSGQIVLINVQKNGRFKTSDHSILLEEEDEEITYVCRSGTVIVLGSSRGELFTIRRSSTSKSITADRMLRSQSIFAGFLSTSAKMIGLAGPSSGSSPAIIKILPLPYGSSNLLISISKSEMCLWKAYKTPGEEFVVWSVDLQEILSEDILTVRGSGVMCTIVDAHLKQGEEGAEEAILLVLSHCMVGGKTQLWMHTLQVATPRNPIQPSSSWSRAASSSTAAGAAASSRHVSVVHREMVSESILVSSASRQELALPKIVSQAPSWRLFIAWESAQHQQQQQQSRRGEPKGTIHCAQYDILNQSTSSTLTPSAGSRAEGEAVLARCRTQVVVDSRVSSGDALCVGDISGVDGVSICSRDGTICVVCPPIHRIDSTIEDDNENGSAHAPRNRSRADRALGSSVRDRVVVNVGGEHLEELLLNVAQGVTDPFDASPIMRNALLSLKSMDCTILLNTVFTAVLNRGRTRESTEKDASAIAGDGGDDAYGYAPTLSARHQMAHRLLDTKVKNVAQLMNLLDISETFNYFPEAVVQLNVYRQQLHLARGVCKYLQDAQQRWNNENMAASTTSAAATTLASLMANIPSQEQRQRENQQLTFASLCHRETLNLVSIGLEAALQERRSAKRVKEVEQQLQLQGGTQAEDEFFADVTDIESGLYTIAVQLTAVSKAASVVKGSGSSSSSSRSGALHENGNNLLAAAFGVMSIVLSGLEAAAAAAAAPPIGELGVGAASNGESPTSVAESATMRETCLLILDTIHDAVKLGATINKRDQNTQQQQQQQQHGGGGYHVGGGRGSPYFTPIVEGQRLYDMCVMFLAGYAAQAARSAKQQQQQHRKNNNSAPTAVFMTSLGEHMAEEWRMEYEHAKNMCTSVLLALGMHSPAFALSTEYLHFSGLMSSIESVTDASAAVHSVSGLGSSGPLLGVAHAHDSIDTSSSSSFNGAAASASTLRREDRAKMIKQLESLLRSPLADRTGTHSPPMPLAHFCLEWCVAHGRPAEVLTLGASCANHHLQHVVDAQRPRGSLSWIYYLQGKNYRTAAARSVEHAHTLRGLNDAETVSSIAKLSAFLAEGVGAADGGDAVVKQLMPPSPTAGTGLGVNAGVENKWEESLDAVKFKLNIQLACIQAQKRLELICPTVFANPAILALIEPDDEQQPHQQITAFSKEDGQKRLNITSLVVVIAYLIRNSSASGEGGTTSGGAGSSRADHTEEISLGRDALLQCTSLGLSLLSMQIEYIDKLAQTASEQAAAVAKFTEKSPAGCVFEPTISMEDVEQQQSTIEASSVLLWAAALSCDACLWLELGTADQQKMGNTEEEAICDSLLYKAMQYCAQEVLHSLTLDSSLLLSPEKIEQPRSAPAVPNNTCLLTYVIDQSEIMSRGLSEEGHLVILAEQNRAEKASNVEINYSAVRRVINMCVDMALEAASSLVEEGDASIE